MIGNLKKLNSKQNFEKIKFKKTKNSQPQQQVEKLTVERDSFYFSSFFFFWKKNQEKSVYVFYIYILLKSKKNKNE